jgi:hypothetical protein
MTNVCDNEKEELLILPEISVSFKHLASQQNEKCRQPLMNFSTGNSLINEKFQDTKLACCTSPCSTVILNNNNKN